MDEVAGTNGVTQQDGRIVLEDAQVLELGELPELISAEDRAFLLAQKQGASRFHKNISYRPASGAIRGLADGQGQERMREVMARYSQRATALLTRIAPSYGAAWSLDYASFRPIEEDGRDLPLLRRNDLLHVDAFPTRPTQGGRILRFFTNISLDQPRVWKTGPPFPELARHWAMAAGLSDQVALGGRVRDAANRLWNVLGGARRTPYDRFMLRFHDYLKTDAAFQAGCSKRDWSFAPGTSWAVFTDAVPHAVFSGCYALEQTVIVPVAALRTSASAPIRILEALLGRALA